MKHLLCIFLTILAFSSARAADGDLFPYPVPPADMNRLEERCDYLVSHFWDRFNYKAAASKTEKLNNTFGDWVSFMPYAHADTVHSAINRLLTANKKDGAAILHLARLAESWFYSDSTEYPSEELYLPFARAAAKNGKIKGADKARFELHTRMLENSRAGAVVQHLDFKTPEGLPGSINNYRTQAVVIFFTDHTCDDCSMARVRLAADHNAKALLSAGLLTVLAIEPGEQTSEWLAATTSYPSEWVLGTSEDADSYFNIRETPAFYLLDGRHKVLAKDFNIDGLLRALQQIRSNSGI